MLTRNLWRAMPMLFKWTTRQTRKRIRARIPIIRRVVWRICSVVTMSLQSALLRSSTSQVGSKSFQRFRVVQPSPEHLPLNRFINMALIDLNHFYKVIIVVKPLEMLRCRLWIHRLCWVQGIQGNDQESSQRISERRDSHNRAMKCTSNKDQAKAKASIA